MSKKRGNKKNQDVDEEFDEKPKIINNENNQNQVTSKKDKPKSTKKGKKGKKNDGDWSDDEKFDVETKKEESDEEFAKPAAKKSQKKGK